MLRMLRIQLYSSTIQNLLNLVDTSSNIFATRTLIPSDDVDRAVSGPTGVVHVQLYSTAVLCTFKNLVHTSKYMYYTCVYL